MPELHKLDFPDRDLYILADGDWQGWRSIPCQKEPETVEWIRGFDKGSLFWDVGASVGPYTLIAAALGHTVVAFEPFAPSYGHLQQNVWLNELAMVNCFPLGLSDEAGWALMSASAPYPGSATHKQGEGKMTQGIQLITADATPEMAFTPNHVKIDVDGVELAVIEGGRIVWKLVDSIMVESEPPTVDDITVILDGCGLRLEESWPRWGETKQRNYLYRRAT